MGSNVLRDKSHKTYIVLWGALGRCSAFRRAQGPTGHRWGTCHLEEVPSASLEYNKLFVLNSCYPKSGTRVYCGTFSTIKNSFLLFELSVSHNFLVLIFVNNNTMCVSTQAQFVSRHQSGKCVCPTSRNLSYGNTSKSVYFISICGTKIVLSLALGLFDQN